VLTCMHTYRVWRMCTSLLWRARCALMDTICLDILWRRKESSLWGLGTNNNNPLLAVGFYKVLSCKWAKVVVTLPRPNEPHLMNINSKPLYEINEYLSTFHEGFYGRFAHAPLSYLLNHCGVKWTSRDIIFFNSRDESQNTNSIHK